jgi:hypothetical protein
MKDGPSKHLRIDDAWIAAHAADDNACVNCTWLDGDIHHANSDTRGAIPYGVLVGTAGYIHGYLWDENNASADRFYVIAGVIHDLPFKRIYAQGTTARDIKVLHY